MRVDLFLMLDVKLARTLLETLKLYEVLLLLPLKLVELFVDLSFDQLAIDDRVRAYW